MAAIPSCLSAVPPADSGCRVLLLPQLHDAEVLRVLMENHDCNLHKNPDVIHMLTQTPKGDPAVTALLKSDIGVRGPWHRPLETLCPTHS